MVSSGASALTHHVCTEVGRTPVSTPAPNAVTTVDTALAVRKDVVPDPVNNTLTFDALALSVLAPSVPVRPARPGRRRSPPRRSGR